MCNKKQCCVLFLVVFQTLGSVMNRISEGFDLAASKWKLKLVLSPLMTARSVKTIFLINFEQDWSSISRFFWCKKTCLLFFFLGAVSSHHSCNSWILAQLKFPRLTKAALICKGQRYLWLERLLGNQGKFSFFMSSVLVGCFPQKRRKKYSSPALLDLIPV